MISIERGKARQIAEEKERKKLEKAASVEEEKQRKKIEKKEKDALKKAQQLHEKSDSKEDSTPAKPQFTVQSEIISWGCCN